MDAVAINQAIQSLLPLLDAEKVLSRIGYHTESIRQTGQVLRAFCPIHKETLIRSLAIDTSQRHFRCSYARCSGARGGNLFDLYILSTQKDPQTALIEWQKELGLTTVPGLSAGAEKPSEEIQAPPSQEIQPTADREPSSVEQEPVPVSGSVETSNLQNALQDLDTVLGPVVESRSESMPEEKVSEEISGPLLADITAAIENLDESPPEPAAGSPSAGTVRPAGGAGFENELMRAIEVLDSGNAEQALELCKEVLRLAESNDEKGQTRIVMGRCHLTAHRYTQAQRELKTGLETSGLHMETEQELRYYLGLTLEARKDLRSALATLKGLVAEHGPFRDTSQVIQRIERAIQNLPASPGGQKISFV